MKIENILRQATDFHVHIGPEIIPRKNTAKELAETEAGKLRGVALKSHFFSTVPFVKEVKKTRMKLFGSVTLNNYVGGLNVDVVRASAELSDSPIVVWFPTISARNFLDKSKYEIAPEWVSKNFISRLAKNVVGISVLDRNENLRKEAIEVLETIKKYKCILATGHISWKESVVLIREAIKIGIKKIIITHPIYQKIDMPKEVQKQLTEKGALIEVAASMYYIDKISIKKIVEQIKFVGANKCILTSDSGQKFSKKPSEVLKDFVKLLLQNGIREREIKQMLINNPNKLLS
ncbi:MAG TPA: DUF6282 family protein [archaeon]|nr:DUF6282 family protein [archaeon]